MLACDITVVHLLFLDLYETFLTFFLLDNVNTITIYFAFVKYYIITIEIKVEMRRRSMPWAYSVDWLCDKYDYLICCLYRIIDKFFDLVQM